MSLKLRPKEFNILKANLVVFSLFYSLKSQSSLLAEYQRLCSNQGQSTSANYSSSPSPSSGPKSSLACHSVTAPRIHSSSSACRAGRACPGRHSAGFEEFSCLTQGQVRNRRQVLGPGDMHRPELSPNPCHQQPCHCQPLAH